MGSDGLGDVAEGVDRRPPDGLLVRLQQLQQLEADAHPLAGGHVLGAWGGRVGDNMILVFELSELSQFVLTRVTFLL